MKVTVINKNESIIYHGKIYKEGETFEVDETIGNSLVSRGCVAIVSEGEDVPLEELTYNELKALAAEKGLPTTGKKDDLITRIREAESATDGTTETEDESEEAPATEMPE